MSKKNLISFLSRKDTPEFDGIVHYKNPNLFTGRVPAYSDYVLSDNQEIVKAYTDKGVKDYAKVSTTSSTRKSKADNDATSAWTKQPNANHEDSQQQESDGDAHSSSRYTQPVKEIDNGLQQTKEEEEREVIPNDWESLPFFTQLAIAKKVAPNETVKTKADVIRILRK